MVTYFGDGEAGRVCELVERMGEHLTAAVVSSDAAFVRRILARRRGPRAGRAAPAGSGVDDRVTGTRSTGRL